MFDQANWGCACPRGGRTRWHYRWQQRPFASLTLAMRCRLRLLWSSKIHDEIEGSDGSARVGSGGIGGGTCTHSTRWAPKYLDPAISKPCSNATAADGHALIGDRRINHRVSNLRWTGTGTQGKSSGNEYPSNELAGTSVPLRALCGSISFRNRCSKNRRMEEGEIRVQCDELRTGLATEEKRSTEKNCVETKTRKSSSPQQRSA